MTVRSGATEEERREMYRAWAAVKYAIKTGTLVRPSKCSHCGKRPGRNKRGRSKIEAHHHKGYSGAHKLDIVWLCSKCHKLADLSKPVDPSTRVGGMIARLKALAAQRETQGV
jgi:hypothetical protein